MDESSALGRRQLERCEAFERQKQRLYKAISLVIGDTLVPVLDFFRYERHYYAVSEAVQAAISLPKTSGSFPQASAARFCSSWPCASSGCTRRGLFMPISSRITCFCSAIRTAFTHG